VFTLAGHVGVREHHNDVLPAWVVVQSIVDIIAEAMS
jgi:hypothetical protein